MERYPCSICSKSFSNGKALGGHMRAHLAFHPLPPKPQELEDLNKANPSTRLRSREGKDQDDSSNKSPEKVPGKRPRQCKSIDAMVDVSTKVKTPGLVSVPSPIEDVVLSLMMLYNGEWKNDIEEKQKGKREMRQDNTINEDESKTENNDDGNSDNNNNNEYTFYPAMAWAKIQTQMVTRTKAQAVACDKGSQSDPMLENPEAIEAQLCECESCPKVFKSRQALGGLMKIHAPSSSDYAIPKHNLIDLNLPPPEGDDEIN